MLTMRKKGKENNYLKLFRERKSRAIHCIAIHENILDRTEEPARRFYCRKVSDYWFL